MDSFGIIILSLLVFIIGIVVQLFTVPRYKPIVALIFIAAISVLTSVVAVRVIWNIPEVISINLAGIFEELIIKVDSLSAWFILLINFTVLNGTLYGIGYLKSYENLKTNLSIHWIALIIFHSSMLWVCMLEHGLAFLVAWEVMSLSSMVLVLFEYQNKETLKAGINYMIQMHISVVLLTIGFIWLYAKSGSFNFSSIANYLSSDGSIWLAVILILGFAIKAGFIPFHSWLPHAHPAAPSHISGIMSGVIVKLGIYGILRIISNVQSNFIIIGEIILIVSIFTSLYGIINGAVKNDYKKLLAYCTIENIGIIGIAIGIGMLGLGYDNQIMIILGFSGALLHSLNHSLYKSILFFSVGSVYQQTHTRNMDRLGGLIRSMPQTAIIFLISGLAIAGLPPFNGFISELIIYTGLINGLTVGGLPQLILLILTIAGLALVGGISLHTFTKSFAVIFTGTQRKEIHNTPHEVSLWMRFPQYLTIAVMFSIAFAPTLYYKASSKLIFSVLSPSAQGQMKELPLESTLSIVGVISMIFILLIIGILAIRYYLLKKSFVQIDDTWGCGYEGEIPKAQYTGLSFSRSFSGLLSFIAIEKKKYHKIEKNDIFPKQRSFTSIFYDILEQFIITPITIWLRYLTNLFQFIQNGKIQTYVLYGILFIILIFIGTILSWI